MKITRLHVVFKVPTDSNYSERIGFSVSLDEGETPESIVSQLRERAIDIGGKPTMQMYQNRADLKEHCQKLEEKLELLRKEWNATAEFLKAQGLNPVAPSMPQFRNLLTAVTVETVAVVDEDDEDYEDEDDYEEDD